MRKLNTHYLLLTASTVIAALTLIFAGRFTVIGHRGEYFSNRYGTEEHTFRSYDNALTDGADWLEIDLEQSSDGVLVIVMTQLQTGCLGSITSSARRPGPH